MYYLNTTRHLNTAPSDEVIGRLMTLLTDDIAPKAATLDGLQNISWLLSLDGMTLQAFSGWKSADDLPRAEHSDQHVNNGKIINELLGGLATPQEHSHFRLLGERSFG